MAQRQFIDATCDCGTPLARYRKSGKGRLVKMFLDKIDVDRARIFHTKPPPKLHEEIHRPGCGNRVATLHIIRGRPAAKANQGSVWVVCVRSPDRGCKQENMVTIRFEQQGDYAVIRNVTRLAFGQPDEADIVERLRGLPNVTSWAALIDDQVVGPVLFSPVSIHHPRAIIRVALSRGSAWVRCPFFRLTRTRESGPGS